VCAFHLAGSTLMRNSIARLKSFQKLSKSCVNALRRLAGTLKCVENQLASFPKPRLSPRFPQRSGYICIGLLPNAQAVVPAPDGGYPGGNTANGPFALSANTTGFVNTATGSGAL